MLEKENILEIDYSKFHCSKISHQTFDCTLILDLITQDFKHIPSEIIGESFLNRPIQLLKIGKGDIKVLLWSQMHGDEPTATAAIFDILTFLSSDQSLALDLLQRLSLYFIPAVNPDGLESFTRRNAQQIDVNRDFLSLQSPEANILKNTFEVIKPDFAFNLHDQSNLYTNTLNNLVGMAFLAPPSDSKLNITWNRTQAMKVIVEMNHLVQKLIPLQTAKFKDEFEPRAFGDNFQKACPTILIESGFLPHDHEKQEIRKLNFYAIIKAFHAIGFQTYQEIDLLNYAIIPSQSINSIHLKISNCHIKTKNGNFKVDIGLNYTSSFKPKERSLEKQFKIVELGDLKDLIAHQKIDAEDYVFEGDFEIERLANFKLKNESGEILHEWKLGTQIR
ncbi:MAG: DUF2817 domain-containing protein [Sphingobacteriales bacterium]|nr:DUF2817 domain-containing protein [Sphingobacteriales bacterium]